MVDMEKSREDAEQQQQHSEVTKSSQDTEQQQQQQQQHSEATKSQEDTKQQQQHQQHSEVTKFSQEDTEQQQQHHEPTKTFPEDTTRYRVLCFYKPMPNTSKVDFIIALISSHECDLTYIREKFSEYKEEKIVSTILFEDDAITLDLPLEPVNGWKFVPNLLHPKIAKVDVQHCQPSRPLHAACSIAVEWVESGEPKPLSYKVQIKGAKKPDDFFYMHYCPQPVEKAPSFSPEDSTLSEKIQTKFQQFGEFNPNDLQFLQLAEKKLEFFLAMLEYVKAIAKTTSGNYFMPCALPYTPNSKQEILDRVSEYVWIIKFERVLESSHVEFIPVPAGYLLALVVSLLARFDKFFATSRKHQYRDCITLVYKDFWNVCIVEHRLQLEVYFTGCEFTTECSDIRKFVLEAMMETDKRLCIDQLSINKIDCFLCSCGEGSSHHLCTYRSNIVECEEHPELPLELNDNQRIWIQSEQQNGKGTEEEEPTYNYEAVKVEDTGSTESAPSIIQTYESKQDNNSTDTTKRSAPTFLKEPRKAFKCLGYWRLWLTSVVIVLLHCVVYQSCKLYSMKPSVAPDSSFVYGETVLTIVGDKPQELRWPDYGFYLDIPEGALPPDVTASVTVKVISGEQFELPENNQFISAVYWISSSEIFLKEVAVSIQHRAFITSEDQLSKFKFVIAKGFQDALPYDFNENGRFVFPNHFKAREGLFRAHTQYGTIKLNQFSLIAVTAPPDTKTLSTGLIYYKQLFTDPLTARFVKDIKAFLQVAKDEVSNFQVGRRIPHCALELQLLGGKARRLLRKVDLTGVASPDLLCYSQPENNPQNLLKKEPRLHHLQECLLEMANKWFGLGTCLQVKSGKLESLSHNVGMSDTDRLLQVFIEWNNSRCSHHTFENLIHCLKIIDMNRYIEKIMQVLEKNRASYSEESDYSEYRTV